MKAAFYFSSRWEVYLTIVIIGLLMAWSFYLGANTTTNNTKIVSSQIYQQGYTEGQLYMENQCRREIAAYASNCNEWNNPDMTTSHYNLTGGKE
jgi:hypothetical protein